MPARYYPFVTILSLSILYGLFRFRTLRKAFKWLVVLMCINLASDSIGRWLIFKIGTNSPVFHVILPIHAATYFIIYSNLFKIKNWGTVAFVAIGGISIFSSLLAPSLRVFPSIGVNSLAFLLVTFSLIGFLELSRDQSNVPLIKQPKFWFLFGNLFFFSITFFAFAFINFTHQLFPNWIIWVIYYSNILLYLSYFLSLFMEKNHLKALQ